MSNVTLTFQVSNEPREWQCVKCGSWFRLRPNIRGMILNGAEPMRALVCMHCLTIMDGVR